MQLMLWYIQVEEGYDEENSCELDKRKHVDKIVIEFSENNLINYVLRLFLNSYAINLVHYGI